MPDTTPRAGSRRRRHIHNISNHIQQQSTTTTAPTRPLPRDTHGPWLGRLGYLPVYNHRTSTRTRKTHTHTNKRRQNELVFLFLQSDFSCMHWVSDGVSLLGSSKIAGTLGLWSCIGSASPCCVTDAEQAEGTLCQGLGLSCSHTYDWQHCPERWGDIHTIFSSFILSNPSSTINSRLRRFPL